MTTMAFRPIRGDDLGQEPRGGVQIVGSWPDQHGLSRGELLAREEEGRAVASRLPKEAPCSFARS
jgi:hypothetical protein